jgi:hypothetical protein
LRRSTPPLRRVSFPGIERRGFPGFKKTIGDAMRYRLGRFLQVAGMIIAPLGVAGNILDKNAVTERHMLTTLCVGLLVFGLGRVIQGPGPGG